LIRASRQDMQISIACPRELAVDSGLPVLLPDSYGAVTPGQKTLIRFASGSSSRSCWLIEQARFRSVPGKALTGKAIATPSGSAPGGSPASISAGEKCRASIRSLRNIRTSISVAKSSAAEPQLGPPKIQERQYDSRGHDAATVIAQPSGRFRDTHAVASPAVIETCIHRPSLAVSWTSLNGHSTT
jgi:hypothetical protein